MTTNIEHAAKVIEAWETDGGDCVVIGTHDRIEGMIALQKWFRTNCHMHVTNVHFAGVRSWKMWAHLDWESLEEGNSVLTDQNTGIPALFFEEGVSYAWDMSVSP